MATPFVPLIVPRLSSLPLIDELPVSAIPSWRPLTTPTLSSLPASEDAPVS